MSYAWLKLLHLLALLFWIGPSLGAYYFLVRAHKEGDHVKICWAEAVADRVLIAEHVAFAVVILSGFGLVAVGRWDPSSGWLFKKLLLFAGVILFEVYDIWVAHFAFAGWLSAPPEPDEPHWAELRRHRKRLLLLAIPVAFLLIPSMSYLAVVKS